METYVLKLVKRPTTSIPRNDISDIKYSCLFLRLKTNSKMLLAKKYIIVLVTKRYGTFYFIIDAFGTYQFFGGIASAHKS